MASDAEEADGAAVVSVDSLAFVLVDCESFCIPHVLWYRSFLLALVQDYMQ